MNHPTPELLVSKKKMKSAHAVNAAEREFETLRFMCSEERGIFRRSVQKKKARWRAMPVTRKVRICSLHASSSLLTFHLTKKRPCARLLAGLDKGDARVLVRVWNEKRTWPQPKKYLPPLPQGWRAMSLFTRFCGYASCRKGLPSPPSWKLMLTPG